MSEKRPADPLDGKQRVKRSRFGPAQNLQNGNGLAENSPAAPQNATQMPAALPKATVAKPLIDKEALKARLKALKEASEKKAQARSQQGQSTPGARLGLGGLPIAQPTAPRPAPLRIDDQGREIDADGKVIERLKPQIFKANQRQDSNQAERAKKARPEDFFDVSLGEKASRRDNFRQRKGFDFVKAGAFQKTAEQQRLKAVFGDKAQRELRDKRENERKAATQDKGDPNLIPLGVRKPAEVKPPKEPIPEVEWWDVGLMQNKLYEIVEEEITGLRDDKITIYVEHPVPLDPPAEDAQPPPMPLPLTQRERKKLRTQRRLEKEKEKQELIRQGLMEPPKPKVKLSTFHRSMGIEASMDPTAVEAQVRADQDARQQAHEDRNLANKLTPDERREKKVKKLTGAANEGEATPVSVYRVSCNPTPQQLFKIKVNAEELHMTGCIVMADSAAIIVAEGGPKAQKKYAHIVLNRIQWKAEAADDNIERPPADCKKSWTGTVKTAAFDKFMVENCRTEQAGRKFLADRGVEQYWDLATADKDS